MPKIIVTTRYIKPTAHKKIGNYIKYIATREGVAKPIPQRKNNAELDREIFMNYLDSRPNSHGLFSEKDNPIVLDKAAKEVANHKGAIWTHIVSLKRTDAERMGYIDLEHWRDLVRRHISDIATAQKIKPENIRRCAAFHNKKTNPHMHIVTYSVDPKEGYLTKEGIEKIRMRFLLEQTRTKRQNKDWNECLNRLKIHSQTAAELKVTARKLYDTADCALRLAVEEGLVQRVQQKEAPEEIDSGEVFQMSISG